VRDLLSALDVHGGRLYHLTWCTGRRPPDDHVHYIRSWAMVPRDADNIAAGRCVDADISTLSAIRDGSCIAGRRAAARSTWRAGAYAIDYATFSSGGNLDRR
jgi:hypothetical protein